MQLSFTGTEGAAYRGSVARASFTPNGHLVHLGTRGWVECVSSAQIDGDGSINLSAIGDYGAPKVRLPAGREHRRSSRITARCSPTSPNHDTRTLVEKVDFATGRRVPIGAERRARPPASSADTPVLILTPLAVLRKDDDETPFKIESLTPGVTAVEVVERTGFGLRVDGEPPPTAEPTAEQLRLLREEIDPLGTARFLFPPGEERLRYLEGILDREWEAAATAPS